MIYDPSTGQPVTATGRYPPADCQPLLVRVAYPDGTTRAASVDALAADGGTAEILAAYRAAPLAEASCERRRRP